MESPSCLVMSFHLSLLSSPMAADNGNCTRAPGPMMNTRDKQKHTRTIFPLCLGEKQTPFPYELFLSSMLNEKLIQFVQGLLKKRMGTTQR